MIVTPKVETDLNLGNVKTLTVPDNTLWRIRNIYMDYICSATVGNRVVLARIDRGSETIWRSSDFTLTASQSGNWMFNPSIGSFYATATAARRGLGAGVNTANQSEPLPDMWLVSGQILNLYDLANIDAAADRLRYQVTYEQIDDYKGYQEYEL